MSVIVIEGFCSAGKTTLIEAAAAKLGAAVMPELPLFAGNLFAPVGTAEASAHNEQVSFELERFRLRWARDLREHASLVLMDRCILSTLVIGYSWVDTFGARSFFSLASKLSAALRSGDFEIPDVIAYLEGSPELSRQRNATRVPPLSEFWIDHEALNRQLHAYTTLFAGLDGVVSLQAGPSPAELVTQFAGKLDATTQLEAEALADRVDALAVSL